MLVEIGTGASLGKVESRAASGASSSRASGLPPVSAGQALERVRWNIRARQQLGGIRAVEPGQSQRA